MNCPKCGNELAPNTEVCEKCKEAVAQPAPSAPQKQKKGKKNLALKITAIVLAVIVFLTGGLFITDAIIFSTESKKGDFVTDFPILKQKTDLLVYDAEKFPYENYNIKVDRFKTGKVFKSSTFSSFENIINEQSNNPIFSIDFKEDGKYQITLEGIVAERTQAVTESTTKKEEPKTIVIIVIVDNDNEKAVDKVTINSKKDDKPIEDLSGLLSSQGNAGTQNITTIAAGMTHSVGLKNDGTVVSVGFSEYGQCEVGDWKDIVSISAGDHFTVGLKSDGTVVSTCSDLDSYKVANSWTDITAIAAGGYHFVGLKADGTVVAAGDDSENNLDVDGWKNIVSVAAGAAHTVGLKSDGTVVATGWNEYGQCEVNDWKDIVAVSAGTYCTVGVKSDGTIVIAGFIHPYAMQPDLNEWTDIVSVSVGYSYMVGLKSDGTAIAYGFAYDDRDNPIDVSGWKDIVSVSVGSNHCLGLKSDGTVVATGSNEHGQCDVSGWKNIKVPGKTNAPSIPSDPETPSAPAANQGAEDVAVKYLEAIWSGCDLEKMSQVELFGYESMLDTLDEQANYKYHSTDAAAYQKFAEKCNADFSDAAGCFEFLAGEAYKEYSPELEYGSGYTFKIDVVSSEKIEKAEAFEYIDKAEDPAKGAVPADKMEEKYASLTDFSVLELKGTRSGSNKSDEHKMEIILGYDGENWYVLCANDASGQCVANMGFAILRGLMEYYMN